MTGALALGAVATGMLLGHWYLIDLGLSIVPLRRLFNYFVVVIVLHMIVLALTVALMALAPAPAAAVCVLWTEHGPLLAARVLLGLIAALGLAYMIHRTLQVPADDGRDGTLLHSHPVRDGGRAFGTAHPLPHLAAALK